MTFTGKTGQKQSRKIITAITFLGIEEKQNSADVLKSRKAER